MPLKIVTFYLPINMILSIDETKLDKNLICDVQFKDLKTFPDDRGFFREVVRVSDDFFREGFGQWSHSKMGKDTVKAWHFHHRQVDWWYVGLGVIHTVLYDLREESPTFKKKLEFKLGENSLDPQALTAVVRIPTGVLHGCKVLSEQAHLFYITSRTYDPNDEGRFPFNSEIVPHKWGGKNETLIVAENDKRTFMPTQDRIPIDF
ncbi:MAG: dTDP-4-dehydrorhamnose 3,5-epimerase family protein [Deltaproteobacteria bacterium]|nr:dTDP-4-dehydrorhamnose 3,5-epimerase family protein [Deltaproteobacteria bacterium]